MANILLLLLSDPLDTELSIFKKLRFASCMISVSPKQIDTNIEIEGSNIKNNAYTWIVNNPSELGKLGRLFNLVRKELLKSIY